MKLPPDFFRFDAKDTLRLVVWIVIASFSIGGLYAQRKADLERIELQNAARDERIAKLEKAVEKTQEGQAAIMATLQTVSVDLRYINEKIDVLRADIRAAATRSRQGD